VLLLVLKKNTALLSVKESIGIIPHLLPIQLGKVAVFRDAAFNRQP
jgi:hypothetical protein